MRKKKVIHTEISKEEALESMQKFALASSKQKKINADIEIKQNAIRKKYDSDLNEINETHFDYFAKCDFPHFFYILIQRFVGLG